MKILVSGFKPFLNQKINPSQLLAIELGNRFSEVDSIVLPVEFENSFQIFKERIIQINPDLILMLGQARGRKKVCLEKIGLNWIQSGHQDEKGIRPLTGSIVSDAPLALMSQYPLEKLTEKMDAVDISFSAGTYVCNDLYFRVLHEFKSIKSIFIHVPLLPEQMMEDDVYSLEYEKQLQILCELVHRVRTD
ncbi:MAG: hypothetical protein A2622_01145 [Bdellovibrionales bacterium RIFCSPHIGHO2_01_FULL_40_29]|nr:MAG: hypothetical protein A2622_01145 [Bdellovibrionales bacterium RIFCSPHIGHO2_01_FULL_40_29]OFZ32719.1 MAG: hypothetical protein A3D17_05745 [Bdellovibrionales bacterium RIFCSPHIGHO2_02_FULL_40_15]